jgi:hypothetical protein
MDTRLKARILERFLFVALLLALGVTGALYERNKETVEAMVLLPSLIAFMLASYAVYRGLLWLVKRSLTPRD